MSVQSGCQWGKVWPGKALKGNNLGKKKIGIQEWRSRGRKREEKGEENGGRVELTEGGSERDEARDKSKKKWEENKSETKDRQEKYDSNSNREEWEGKKPTYF